MGLADIAYQRNELDSALRYATEGIALCRQFVRAGVPLGYLARLQRAFGTGRPGPDPVPAGIVDPLTSRELEVLEMLAVGRSNQAIACELVVTLDTVKKHVGHVLGKLGAANRTEAVARARELSLIP